MLNSMLKVGIVGGSGYTGGELLRLLSCHPEADAVCVTSRKLAGKPVDYVHPHLLGISNLKFEAPSASEISERCDVVFTAVPHGTAMDWVPELLDFGAKVIDLSSDYRLPVDVFEKTYGTKHRAPRDAVFGLTELHRQEVASARLVGNPGCYPTGATLAVAPLADAGLVDRVVYDSKSGISGAGVEPTATSQYPNMAENIIPYKLHTHATCLRSGRNSQGSLLGSRSASLHTSSQASGVILTTATSLPKRAQKTLCRIRQPWLRSTGGSIAKQNLSDCPRRSRSSAQFAAPTSAI
jgi:N-acetyl-gamma-glutamyl-phosphate reductase common form